jgi:hypothetical protein
LDWPRCYHHPELKLLLVIYVDDFKLSGPAENFKKGWAFLKQGLKIDDPADILKVSTT